MCVSVCVCHFKVARELTRGASGGRRSGRPSWEPCRAEGGPHRQRHHHHHRRRRVGWEGREPPLPPPPPGWAPFSVDVGDPGRGRGGSSGRAGAAAAPASPAAAGWGAVPAPHCATPGGGGGRRTPGQHPRTSLVSAPGPVSARCARGWSPA